MISVEQLQTDCHKYITTTDVSEHGILQCAINFYHVRPEYDILTVGEYYDVSEETPSSTSSSLETFTSPQGETYHIRRYSGWYEAEPATVNWEDVNIYTADIKRYDVSVTNFCVLKIPRVRDNDYMHHYIKLVNFESVDQVVMSRDYAIIFGSGYNTQVYFMAIESQSI